MIVVPGSSVVTFDRGVLLRLVRLDKRPVELSFLGPN